MTASRPNERSPAQVALTRLAVARRLLEMGGGTLREDPTEQGAVELFLPSTGPETVLVVDDNPDVLHLFRRYLGGGRYRVIVAQDARSALRLAPRVKPEAITLDLMMPMRDGWEILQGLRSHPETRDVPVVVCSVLDERELALALGATEFLAKPVTQQELLTALDRCRQEARERRDWTSSNA
ncbi:MAG: response regulator [Chloroflexi bacterium]|nr:response regulator [Chloroflexota bacterium]